MRIVNRKQFLAMPENTVFSKYVPCCFDSLEIKGDSIGGNDFSVQQVADAVDANDSEEFADILLDAQENGVGFKMNLSCECRDGLFEEDQLFAVWDNNDVQALIDRLTETLVLGDPSGS